MEKRVLYTQVSNALYPREHIFHSSTCILLYRMEKGVLSTQVNNAFDTTRHDLLLSYCGPPSTNAKQCILFKGTHFSLQNVYCSVQDAGNGETLIIYTGKQCILSKGTHFSLQNVYCSYRTQALDKHAVSSPKHNEFHPREHIFYARMCSFTDSLRKHRIQRPFHMAPLFFINFFFFFLQTRRGN